MSGPAARLSLPPPDSRRWRGCSRSRRYFRCMATDPHEAFLFDEPAPADGGWHRHEGTGDWWVCPPGRQWCRIPKHNVVAHDDGTITVSPSIFYNQDGEQHWGGAYPMPDTMRPWHGYLEAGVFREL